MAHTYFVMRQPGQPDRVLVWDTRTLSIGRSPENDLVVEDEEISRKHALLKNEGGAMEVGDYRTGNGTFVNGERVQQTARIQSGDVITFGKIQLELRHGDEHPAKLGAKLTYASHLKTVGSIPQMADANSTMIGMMDTQQADEPFVIEPERSSGGQAFVLGESAEDELQMQALDDSLDDIGLELSDTVDSPVLDLDAELDLMDPVEPPVAKPRTAAPTRAPAPPPAPAPAPDRNAQTGSDLMERMQNLKSLHDAGLITDAEFQAKRAEILEEV
jgi:pSer/pThr/pTyr-binding forkhead associated (FHA) protein